MACVLCFLFSVFGYIGARGYFLPAQCLPTTQRELIQTLNLSPGKATTTAPPRRDTSWATPFILPNDFFKLAAIERLLL